MDYREQGQRRMPIRPIRVETQETDYPLARLLQEWPARVVEMEKKLEHAESADALADIVRSCNLRAKIAKVRGYRQNPQLLDYEKTFQILKHRTLIRAAEERRRKPGTIKIGRRTEYVVRHREHFVQEILVFEFATSGSRPYLTETNINNLARWFDDPEEFRQLFEPYDTIQSLYSTNRRLFNVGGFPR